MAGMELNMRYAVAADGVRIACATAGNGLPCIRAPWAPYSHCQLEWRQGTFFERLCRSRMIVPFDPRGTGLSDRDVGDYSLEAREWDIDAVANTLGLTSFALHGIGTSGALAISYAVRHPDRVSHLILDDAFANGRTYADRPQVRAVSQMYDDWEAMTENVAFASHGLGGDDVRRYGEYLRACTTPEAARRMGRAFEDVDVTEILPRVEAPTLIMQHKATRFLGANDGRELAMGIPNSRLVVIEGGQGEIDSVLSAVGEFFGDTAAAARPGARPTAVRAVLFTDIESHTEMLRRLGDEAGRAVLRDHERVTREVLRAHAGTEIKSMGDGFMASFDSATDAVECAIDLQRAFAARNEAAAEPIRVRVGVNAGEPIAEDDDLFGTAVTVAARIMGRARGTEIIVSDVVRALVAGKGFQFIDRGAEVLKGFEEPVRLHEVQWRERPG